MRPNKHCSKTESDRMALTSHFLLLDACLGYHIRHQGHGGFLQGCSARVHAWSQFWTYCKSDIFLDSELVQTGL